MTDASIPPQGRPPEPDDPEAQQVSAADAVPFTDPDATLAMPGQPAGDAAPKKKGGSTGLASVMIAAGILLSRVAGLVRDRVIARYFGASEIADVFRAGLRIPNFLQNLLGEGTLSASFIPVYAELLHEGRKEEAGKVAGAIFSLLLALAGAVSLLGIIFAPQVTAVLTPGFEGVRRDLTITITRILFPMAGILVLSAWSLGILNSHRHFFLSYVAPVCWNVAMIATLFALGGKMSAERLVVALSWGALVGGVLQLVVQLPTVLKLERQLKINWGTRLQPVRDAVKNAGPAIMGRGVVQISAWIDTMLASFLATGGVAIISYAMTLYVLPISLFGMSVAAAELPEMSRQRMAGDEALRLRTSLGTERIAFYVVPSFVAFLLLGDQVVGGIYQNGQFGRNETLAAWVTLAGFASGLLASSSSRLFSSAYFALRDTRTPARYATLRVTLSIVLGILFMLQFEGINVGWLHVPVGIFGNVTVGGYKLGPFGLALGAGIAAWVEWYMLRRTLSKRIGKVGARLSEYAKMFTAALAGAAAGWGVKVVLPVTSPLIQAVVVLGVYGLVYFVVAAAVGLEESATLLRRVKRVAGR